MLKVINSKGFTALLGIFHELADGFLGVVCVLKGGDLFHCHDVWLGRFVQERIGGQYLRLRSAIKSVHVLRYFRWLIFHLDAA